MTITMEMKPNNRLLIEFCGNIMVEQVNVDKYRTYVTVDERRFVDIKDYCKVNGCPDVESAWYNEYWDEGHGALHVILKNRKLDIPEIKALYKVFGERMLLEATDQIDSEEGFPYNVMEVIIPGTVNK